MGKARGVGKGGRSEWGARSDWWRPPAVLAERLRLERVGYREQPWITRIRDFYAARGVYVQINTGHRSFSRAVGWRPNGTPIYGGPRLITRAEAEEEVRRG